MRAMGVVVLGVVLIAGSAAAQERGYVGVDVGLQPVSGLVEASALRLGVVAGYRVAGGWIELGAGRLEERQRQQDWSPQAGEAPLRAGVSILDLQASYRRTLPAGDLPVDPALLMGGDWLRVTDRWESDTPEEHRTTSLWGLHAGAELRVDLGFGGWLAVRGSYRALRADDARPPLALDPGNWRAAAIAGLAF